MDIKLIDTESGFLELKDDWNRLANDLMPINKFEWMYKWWKHNKDNNQLKILVAEKNGEIKGIAI